MDRTIDTADHEDFRRSCAAFLEKKVAPELESHLSNKAIPRDFWLDAGAEGFLGLEIPGRPTFRTAFSTTVSSSTVVMDS